MFRTDGFWQTGTEAMAGFLPLEWTAEGVVWQGVSASVFVSESGSCVCLWFLVFLGLAFCHSCRPGPRFPCIMPFRSGCRCPQAQGRPSSRSLACVLFGERAGPLSCSHRQVARAHFSLAVSTDSQCCPLTFSDISEAAQESPVWV